MDLKKTFDFAAALGGLVVLGVPIIVVMAIIKRNSPGPAIFAQTRVGRNRQEFTCYKLRTMHVGTKNLPSHKVGDTALTSIGAILRRTKFDELPQLINVLRGEMSLVGPRPCLPIQTELIEARLKTGALGVTPGITGLAQVQGIDMSNPQLLARIDGQYVTKQSFVGDLRLILRTVTGSGLNADASSRKE